MDQPLLDPARLAPMLEDPVSLGGVIRERPEDFVVEEIPLFRPSGRGEHVLFEVEKRGMSTFDALLRVSKGAKVSEQKIGYAGLKDARAVTRQTMSVHRVPPERVLGIEHPHMRVLWATRHTHGLKIGHHRGNRFTIRIRGVERERIGAARRALELLSRRGLPNAYGRQRFGIRQDGHVIGRAIVHEDWATFLTRLLGRPSPLEQNPRMVRAREAYDAGELEKALALFPLRHRTEKKAAATLLRTGSPREAFRALGRRPRRIWVAAWQSFVFNRILERRVRDGTFDEPAVGDLVSLEATGALVPIREGDAEVGEPGPGASPTGPLLGYDLPLADGAPGALEREVLAELGADAEPFRAEHVRSRGHRRALCVRLREASLVEDPEVEGAVIARFVLPPGSFATVVLEILVGGPV